MDQYSEELQTFLILLGQHPDQVSHQKAHYMHHLLQLLSLPEENIMKLYYGLDGNPVRSLSDIAQMCGVNEEQMQQVIYRCLRRISVTPEWQSIKDIK